MGKKLFIAEKPSVAREFANALKVNTTSRDGYLESADVIVTWCVGHLVTMSYPDAYDERLRRWSFDTIPFLPEEYKYEVISPIICEGDIIGGVILLSKDIKRKLTELEQKMAACAAGFLGSQMEQ